MQGSGCEMQGSGSRPPNLCCRVQGSGSGRLHSRCFNVLCCAVMLLCNSCVLLWLNPVLNPQPSTLTLVVLVPAAPPPPGVTCRPKWTRWPCSPLHTQTIASRRQLQPCADEVGAVTLYVVVGAVALNQRGLGQ